MITNERIRTLKGFLNYVNYGDSYSFHHLVKSAMTGVGRVMRPLTKYLIKKWTAGKNNLIVAGLRLSTNYQPHY